MAKRGWRAVARVRFRWENGVHGTEAFYSLDRAESFARQLEARSEVTGLGVEVTLERINQEAK
jgi:hypothetical protein